MDADRAIMRAIMRLTYVLRAAADHGAPEFALDLAQRGCTAANLRAAAQAWRAEGFGPAAVADELDNVARLLPAAEPRVATGFDFHPERARLSF